MTAKLKCVDCKRKGFATLLALQQHAETEHTWCQFCKTGFSTQEQAAQHGKTLTHHCIFCYRCFSSQAGLKEHRKGHETHRQWNIAKCIARINRLAHRRWFICGLCPERYQQLHQLLHHRTTRHVELEKGSGPVAERVVDTPPLNREPLECAIGSRGTLLQSSPAIVEQIVFPTTRKATGSPYRAQLLAPASPSPSTPLSRKYFCSSCTQTIHTFPELVNHLLFDSIHTSQPAMAEAQGFRCQTCAKGFSLPAEFDAHLRRERSHMRWAKPYSCSAVGATNTTATSLECFEERPGSQRRAMIPVPPGVTPPCTPSLLQRRQLVSPAGTPFLDFVLPTTPQTKRMVNTTEVGLETPPASSSYDTDNPELGVPENALEDCITHCRQCLTEFPCVEALVDHYHTDSTHRDDEIWCYTCDLSFGKAHLLWPHLLRSVRHDNAPPGSRFEFSSARYRMAGLMSGMRSSGEAPLEIDYGNLKSHNKRLRLTENLESAKRLRLSI